MSDDPWIMVRIRKSTHRRLLETRESLEHAEEMGLVELARDDRDRVSLDQIIRRLLDRRDRHAERRRRSQRRRCGKAKDPGKVDEG